MRKALVVVDMQQRLTSHPNLYDAKQLLSVVNNAIQKFRQNENPVIFIQHNNKNLAANSSGWEIDNRLDRLPEDPVIQKKHGNAFQETALKALLEKYQISELLFCGISSHGCVKHSCLGSLENNFSTSLLKSGHSCWNKNAKELIEKTEKELAEKDVRLINAANLVF